jgi:uncharacterized protein YecT (DUF1311 family)
MMFRTLLTSPESPQRRGVRLSGLVGLAAFALPLTAQAAPSFDCVKAANPAELAICADERLAEADAVMAKIYHGLRHRLADDPKAVAALKQDQLAFLKHRNRNCTKPAEDQPEASPSEDAVRTCLAALYSDRIAQLNEKRAAADAGAKPAGSTVAKVSEPEENVPKLTARTEAVPKVGDGRKELPPFVAPRSAEPPAPAPISAVPVAVAAMVPTAPPTPSPPPAAQQPPAPRAAAEPAPSEQTDAVLAAYRLLRLGISLDMRCKVLAQHDRDALIKAAAERQAQLDRVSLGYMGLNTASGAMIEADAIACDKGHVAQITKQALIMIGRGQP